MIELLDTPFELGFQFIDTLRDTVNDLIGRGAGVIESLSASFVADVNGTELFTQVQASLGYAFVG